MISVRQYFSSTKNRIAIDPMQFVDDIYRYSLARGVSREDAEDIAIEVTQQAPKKTDPSELKMYMIGMARRKIADHFRKKRDVQPMTLGEATGSLDQKIDVQRVLGTISDTHRECLILKYVNGLTSDEIAQLLETTSDAVDSLLQRARKSFAKEWEIMHGEDDGR